MQSCRIGELVFYWFIGIFSHRGKNSCLSLSNWKMFFKKVSSYPCRHSLVENILFSFQSRRDTFFLFLKILFSINFGFHIASFGISRVHVHKQEDFLFHARQTDLLKCNGSLLGGTRDGFGF